MRNSVLFGFVIGLEEEWAFDLEGDRVLTDAIAPRSWLDGGVRVHADFPGPVDTDMTQGLEIPKASAQCVARNLGWSGERGEGNLLELTTEILVVRR